jgi:hypothetical protein
VYQQGGKLHVLDVPSVQLHDIDVTVSDDGTRTGPRWVDAKSAIREQDASQHINFDIAPNVNRAVLAACGDIHSEPVDYRAQDLPDEPLLGIGRRHLPYYFRKYGLGPLMGTRRLP